MSNPLRNAIYGQNIGATMASTANDNDALIPEVWAAESLVNLYARLLAVNLVHRDFENEIQAYGDVVNTRRPTTFHANRKTDTDQVVLQAATSTRVQVKLDQHPHVSFIIKDGEESKSFKDLVNFYLNPAIEAIAQFCDELVLGTVYQFLANQAGRLGTDVTKSTVIQLREAMNDNNAYIEGRNLILTNSQESDLLGISDFTVADKIGDDGTTMRNASLGRRMGFDIYATTNQPSVASGNTTVTGAVNDSDGGAIGATSIAVDGFSAAIENGSWCTIAGDDTPQKIRSTTGGATPSALTIYPGLKRAVVDDAVVTVYSPGAINYSDGYDALYAGASGIAVDGFTVAPKKGQLVSFDTAASFTNCYSAVESVDSPSTTRVDLNMAVQSALSDGDVCALGPAGNYGFAFHQNAIAFVTRPLAQPRRGAGAMSAVASYNGLGIRVTIQYQGRDQGHLVTVDLLCGVKVLDTNLGAVLLS